MKIARLGFFLVNFFPVFSLCAKPVALTVPNGDCSDSSLKGFRFRYDTAPNMQEQYLKNHQWISHQELAGRKCVAIRAPKSILEMQTAKVESPAVAVEPGATYKYMVDTYLDHTNCKMWAETFGVDPRMDSVREEEEAKGKRVSLFRFRPENGLPALLMVHRSADRSGPTDPKTWGTWEWESTIPMEWTATLPFTIRGDGMESRFPVPIDPREKDVKYEVIEARLRKEDQKLPIRQNKDREWKFENGFIVFSQAPPPKSEVTMMVRWKVKPRYTTIKAISLGGADGSTAAFTNFRIIKTKEPGEAPAPRDDVIR